MILRAFAAAAVIALLAIAWLALNGGSSGPAVPATATVSAQSPGYSARNATLIETGADGLPMYTLHAADIREQPASQVALLDRVEMQFRSTNGQLWQGRADQARVADQAAQVDLSGEVALSGALAGSAEPVRISTARLSVDTHSQVIATPDPVTIDWNGGQLDARGLVARLRDRQIRLESHVHGRYAP
jgi:LPS export ABC transporter protein LptC